MVVVTRASTGLRSLPRIRTELSTPLISRPTAGTETVSIRAAGHALGEVALRVLAAAGGCRSRRVRWATSAEEHRRGGDAEGLRPAERALARQRLVLDAAEVERALQGLEVERGAAGAEDTGRGRGADAGVGRADLDELAADRLRRPGSRGPSPRTSPACPTPCRAPCRARSSRGPGSGWARWPTGAPAKTCVGGLAGALEDGGGHLVEGREQLLEGRALAAGCPASSSRRMLAKSKDSAWPKPCGVWKASAVVVRPSITSAGRGDAVDRRRRSGCRRWC